MDAVVMCGGEGSRLRSGGISTEKPLVTVGGRPMLDRINAALAESRVDTVYAAVSPAAPEARKHARDLSCTVVETPGEGYVADLDHVLADVDRPVLTVAADLPLLTAAVVNRILAVAEDARGRHDRAVDPARDPDEYAVESPNGVPSLAVCVPVALKRRLGASVDTTIPSDAIDPGSVLPELLSSTAAAQAPELAPAGVNVVAGETERTWVSYDARLAVNVNRPADLDLAEALCR
jgi:adenosylcobinamide-phosphate guanylyltransferase